MPQLEKSEKFLSEFNHWREVIENSDNDKVKKEGKILLEKLLRQVRSLDQLHSQIFSGNNNINSNVDDSRHEIASIRKKLDKLVTDYKKSIKSQ